MLRRTSVTRSSLQRPLRVATTARTTADRFVEEALQSCLRFTTAARPATRGSVVLEARLLGQCSVRVGDVEVPLRSRDSIRLFACLALRPGVRQRRERLAALLWPDLDEEHARRQLRSALWRLRGALGDEPFVADRLTVALRAEATWVDVATVEAGDGNDLEAMRAALEAYGGELLPGVDDDWLVAARERLLALVERIADKGLQELVAAGHWDAVVTWAERWIALGQGAEPAYRALMRARHARGDVAGVTGVFERCRTDLRERLGVLPSGETMRLLRSLTSAGTMATQQPIGTSSAPAPAFLADDASAWTVAGDTFVGREAVLTRLSDALDRACNGRLEVVLVTGEAGQGKTSVLRSFVRLAAERHPRALVALAACDPVVGRRAPLAPWRDALGAVTLDVERLWRRGTIGREQARRAWSLLPDLMEALSVDAADLIGTLLPPRIVELLVAGGVEPPPGTATVGRAPRSTHGPTIMGGPALDLRTLVTDLIDVMAARTPWLIVLDDLQWADPDTLDVLVLLTRRSVDRSIMVLGAYRPETLTEGVDGEPHPLQDVVTTLQRNFGNVSVDLDLASADPDWAYRLVDGLFGPARSEAAEAREQIVRRTRGHALFASEMLHELRDRGHVRYDRDGRWTTPTALSLDAMPGRVEVVVAARIARLDDDLRTLLSVACVVGDTFSAELVARALGDDVTRVVSVLDAKAVRAHRLVNDCGVVSDGTGRWSLFQFRHTLLRQHLYTTLGTARRTHLHQTIASAINAMHGRGDSDAVAADLAHHLRAAGDTVGAVPHLVRSAELGLRLGGFERAASDATEALRSIPGGDVSTWAPLEVRARLALGSALQAQRGFADDEVGRVFEEAAARADGTVASDLAFRATWNVWAFRMQRAELKRAEQLTQALYAIAARGGDEGLVVQAHHSAWFTLLCGGAFRASLAACEAGIASYRPDRDHAGCAVFGGHDVGVCAHLTAARASWHLGDDVRTPVFADTALRLAEATADPGTLVHAHIFCAEVHVLRNEHRAALDAARAAVELAERNGLVHWVVWGAMLQACACAQASADDHAVSALHAAIEAYRAIGGVLELPVFMGRLAEARLAIGDALGTLETCREARALATASGEHRQDAELWRIEATALHALGKRSAAVAAARSAIVAAHAHGAIAFEARATATLRALEGR